MTVLVALALAYAGASVWVTCTFLTALAAARRGLTRGPVLLSAAFFPVAWAVWHVQDQRPGLTVSS